MAIRRLAENNSGREQYYLVDLDPKNSNAPTFYNSGSARRISMSGIVRLADADRIVRKFNKTPYTRDYTTRIVPANHNMSEEWERREADRGHEMLNDRFESAIRRLSGQYASGQQPTGGSVSNSTH